MNDEVREIFELALMIFDEARAQNPSRMPRSLVHTSDYAMFHAARAVLLHVNGSASTKHGSVLKGFEALVDAEPIETRRFGEDLRDAYNSRLGGDYTGASISPEEAKDTFALATDFVAYCARRLGVEPPPTARP